MKIEIQLFQTNDSSLQINFVDINAITYSNWVYTIIDDKFIVCGCGDLSYYNINIPRRKLIKRIYAWIEFNKNLIKCKDFLLVDIPNYKFIQFPIK